MLLRTQKMDGGQFSFPALAAFNSTEHHLRFYTNLCTRPGLIALVDPYERTVPYRTYGLFEPLSLSEQQIAGDLESIGDSELEAVSESIIDGNEEVVYESDGLWVEEQLGISGGDDGGGEDPMFTAAESGTVNCEKQYAKNCARCRRIPERRARALCWGLAMAIYAKCRADEEPQ